MGEISLGLEERPRVCVGGIELDHQQAGNWPFRSGCEICLREAGHASHHRRFNELRKSSRVGSACFDLVQLLQDRGEAQVLTMIQHAFKTAMLYAI